MSHSRTDVGSGSAWSTLAVLGGCMAYVLLLAYLPELMARSPLFCPAYRFLGLNCPTCGLTRALACLARWDFVAALGYHPLAPAVAAGIASLALDNLLGAFHRPGLFAAAPRAWRNVVVACCLAAFAGVFLIRTVTWLEPAWNTEQWCIPPTAYPPSAPAARNSVDRARGPRPSAAACSSHASIHAICSGDGREGASYA